MRALVTFLLTVLVPPLMDLGRLSETSSTTTSGAVLDEIHLAKIGLAEFLVEHVDRPLRIADPCPTLSAEQAAQHLTAVGLIPSSAEYGPAIVFEADIGGGLAAVRCGNDLARGAEPAGAVGVSSDVAMLDGQATFDQYAVDLGGEDAEVFHVADPEGELASSCNNGGRDCTVALNVDDLVVTIRLKGLPAEAGEQLAQQLVVAVAPLIIANLAALVPGDA